MSLPFVRVKRSESSAPKTQAKQQAVAQLAAAQPLKPSTMLSWSSIKFFLIEGYRHVIPYGWDHILFIAALCLLSFEWRALVEQSLLFTLAHSLTLALAIQGVVRLPASIVEAIIALSIAWMAIENLFVTRVKPMRLALIGGFGLIHGLGFAYVLGNRISESGRFYQALLFTNLGVELAQLTVIICMFLVFYTCVPSTRMPLVQKCVSACIAVVAIILFTTRL
ncbi:MAG: HupE/UreJ family protein [Pirellulaceae bacterium]